MPQFNALGPEPTWFESGMMPAGDQTAWPPSPPSRADAAYQASIDRWKQLGKDVFFAPSNALHAFMEQPTFNNALGVMPMGGIGKMPIRPATGIRAYHGSPYDFDRFDLSKIGSGEGAQAYGHGLYFAENPKTATRYREQLGYDDFTNPRIAAGAYLRDFGSPEAAMAKMRDHLINGPGLKPNERAGVAQGLELLRSGAKIEMPPTPGKMYEVNINAKPQQFLDFDRPLAGQSESVKSAIGGLGYPVDKLGSVKGNVLRQELGDITRKRLGYPDPAATSNMLRDAGIPGIRYLDEGSRVMEAPGHLAARLEDIQNQMDPLIWASREGNHTPAQSSKYEQLFNDRAAIQDQIRKHREANQTSNYVLFNDQIVDILKKWGLVGGMLGGGSVNALDNRSGS